MNYEYTLSNPLLTVEGVNLTLGGKQILRDVNLQVRDIVRPGVSQGQVVALLGPSGVGKTQLFRIMSGLNKPDSGTVLVGEEQRPVHKGDVGVVAQHYPLFAHRTVFGNLEVAGHSAGLSHAESKAKAASMLERFGLEGHGSKYPVQLSGGQRQRVAIAQQFMCSEFFLLMDEPFSGLDYIALQRVAQFINEIVAQNSLTTFVIVTHDIHAALTVADTVWLLGRERDEQGNIIPGARLQQSYNLIDRGLAWRPGLENSPQFFTTMNEIREAFSAL